jgi:hypothetical protein
MNTTFSLLSMKPKSKRLFTSPFADAGLKAVTKLIQAYMHWKARSPLVLLNTFTIPLLQLSLNQHLGKV